MKFEPARNWQLLPLRDVASGGVFADGDWVESKDQDPEGEVRLIQLADIGEARFLNRSSRFLTNSKAVELGCTFLEEGDVLISRMADPIGRACVFPLIDQKCVTVVDVCIVRPRPEVADNRWLIAAINSPQFRRRVELAASGTTRSRVSRGNLGNLEIPLPSLGEQRRIVAKLEALQARSRRAREALDAVPPLLEKLRQSILAAAFRGDLTKDWRAKNKNVEPASKLLERIRAERRKKWEEAELAKMKAKGKPPTDDKWKAKYKEPEPVDTTGLLELPEGWCWAPVPLLLSVSRVGMRTGPFGSLLGKHDYVSDGIPIVGVESIGRMVFHRIEKHYVTAMKAAALAEYSIKPGDLLVSRSGTVGEVCVVPDGAGPGIISTNTIRLSVDPEIIVPLLLGFALIGAPSVLDQIHSLCSGSTRDFLNQGILSELRIPLPPAGEQRALAARLADALARCDAFEKAGGAMTVSLSALDRAALAKAFRGELVPQDPSDERADAILARLRGESASPPSADAPAVSTKRVRSPKRKAG